MIAVVPVRAGSSVAGGLEAVAEAAGRCVFAGEGAGEAASEASRSFAGLVEVSAMELGTFQPGLWSKVLAPHLVGEPVVVLPASPDGRDLAPRLAHELGRALLASATAVDEHGAVLVRQRGRQSVRVEGGSGFVATLVPGSRSIPRRGEGGGMREVQVVQLSGTEGVVEPGPAGNREAGRPGTPDAETIAVLDADPATMDLAESTRIIAGGAGLGGADQFRLLETVGALLGASVGGTRVVTDAGHLGQERQIGTTGVAVHPHSYVALGISGAAQHLTGVTAERVISVNLDPICPMMSAADLAIVSDAPAVLAELARRLAERGERASA